jgi:hypothetical protein
MAAISAGRSRLCGEFSIEAQHLDDSILALLENSPDLVADAARTHRISLPN